MKKDNLKEIILYIGLLLVGLCLTIWAEKVTNLVSILLGSTLIIYGAFVFINYFKNNNHDFDNSLTFIYGIITLVIGIILVCKVDLLKELVSLIIGVYILLSSIIKLKYSYNLKNKNTTIISIIGLIIGIMCILGKFLIPDIIVTFIGIMLIIYSLTSIIYLIINK